MEKITVTKEFKSRAVKAIFSIFLFIATYIVLFALAVGLTIICGYAGLMLITVKIHFVTLMLGLGLAAVGVLTLFFLIKFIFTSNKTDLSRYLEITEADQPALFALIHDVVNEAGTQFPKKVYLSSEVNASVFYDSSFWSMFLPVRKNLHIGVGLMNSVTVDELKGIIAHEFGHFSQRSMKVGSYVYNVNYIIHNMLYDNESYNNFVSKIANLNGWISLPLIGSVKIIQGIQWVLHKVYEVVNLNYRALSREMEFHADEVAARIAGPHTIETSLVRLGIAGESMNEVLNFYGPKAEKNIKPSCLFAQHLFVMLQKAEEYDLKIENGLPQLTPESTKRFNKSKLEFDSSWSTHPNDADRIARVKSLGLVSVPQNNAPAMSLLHNAKSVEERIITLLYSEVQWTATITYEGPNEFETAYKAEKNNYSFPKKFNKYFDSIELPEIDIDELKKDSTFFNEVATEELFSPAKVNMVYEQLGLEQDLAALNAVVSGMYKVKKFDYDGRVYKAAEAAPLSTELTTRLEELKSGVTQNHRTIFGYYLNAARKSGREQEYVNSYNIYRSYVAKYTTRFEMLDSFYKMLSFTSQALQPEAIKSNFVNVYSHESLLKNSIAEFIEEPLHLPYLPEETLTILRDYVQSEQRYFIGDTYNDSALGSMYAALRIYNDRLNFLLFQYKKIFLDLQAEIEPQTI